MTEIIAHSVDELGDFWARAVYPFVKPIIEADSREGPSPVGSGILVSYCEKHYLLTAHHVTAPILAEPAGDAPGAFYTFIPEQIEIGGLNHHLTDPFDLSMTELPSIPRQSLRLPQHLAVDVQKGELCCCLDFLLDRNHGKSIGIGIH